MTKETPETPKTPYYAFREGLEEGMMLRYLEPIGDDGKYQDDPKLTDAACSVAYWLHDMISEIDDTSEGAMEHFERIVAIQGSIDILLRALEVERTKHRFTLDALRRERETVKQLSAKVAQP